MPLRPALTHRRAQARTVAEDGACSHPPTALCLLLAWHWALTLVDSLGLPLENY